MSEYKYVIKVRIISLHFALGSTSSFGRYIIIWQRWYSLLMAQQGQDTGVCHLHQCSFYHHTLWNLSIMCHILYIDCPYILSIITISLLSLAYKCGNQYSEKLTDLPNAIQLVNGKFMIFNFKIHYSNYLLKSNQKPYPIDSRTVTSSEPIKKAVR